MTLQAVQQGEAISESPAHGKPMKSDSLHTLSLHGHRRIGVRRSFGIPFSSPNGAKYASLGHRPRTHVPPKPQALKGRHNA